MVTSLSAKLHRVSEQFGTTIHTTKRVVVIGQGRSGNPIATLLVRCGVSIQNPGFIYCLDHDVIEDRNIGSQYKEKHLGKLKAEAAFIEISEWDSDANIQCRPLKVTKELIPEICIMGRRSDLVVIAADDPIACEIGDCLYDICPIVMAGFSRNCSLVAVAFSIPGKTVPVTTLFKKHKMGIEHAVAIPCYTEMAAGFTSTICLSILTEGKSRFLPKLDMSDPSYVFWLRKEGIFDSIDGFVLKDGTMVKDGIVMAAIIVNDGQD